MRTYSNVLIAVAVCFASIIPAYAHHILGTPHYAYNDEYPQTPVLSYRAEIGNYDVRMTGFPGKPAPGDRTSLHFYITHLGTEEPFDGVVTLTVLEDHFIGSDPVIYGPVEGELEEAMYKFFPQFINEANYIVRLEYQVDGVPWILDLPMVAGEPGSPWMVIGSAGIGLALFLIVIRAIRIKQTRHTQRKVPVTPNPELNQTN